MIFAKYIKKHGKPFSLRIPNGKGKLTLMFYDGHVTLRSRVPGVRFRQEINMTHSAWVKLLKASVAPTKRMSGPNFDADDAMRTYLAAEAQYQAERKAERRGLDQKAHEARKRARYRRAKARARRRAAGSD